MRIKEKILFAPWAAESKFFTCRQQWYPALKKFFKHILIFDPQKYLIRYGQKEMNKKFLELVKKEKPDYIFMRLINDEFSLETLNKITKISPKTKLINFFGDDDVLLDNFSMYYALFIDYCLVFPQVSIQDYKKVGMENIFCTHGTNLNYFKPLKMKKKYDVTFIGVPKADRYEFLKYLKNNGIKVNIFGTGDWEKYPDLKDAYRGSLKPEELLRVLNQSKITLCFTKNYLGFPHLVGRVFETATCKSFILVEYCPQFLKLLKKDREIVMFKDKKDLLEKVNYYLKHEKERKKIAENAYKRMVRDYNVDTEFKKFFKNIFKDRRTKKLPKLNKKITCISEKDIYLNQKDLNRKLKNTDYVYFKEGFCRSLPFRTYIQAYSLEKLKKQISCCNYYVYSRGLGNYLYFFSHYAFNTLPKKDFSSLITINQLMITKQYFLKNIKKFKHFFRGKEIDFINKQNTAFVSIPLIQINKIKKIQYEDMKKVFEMKFLLKLSSLAHKKKLFSSSYTYKLLLQGLSQNFILKYLSGWFNKKRLKSLMKIYIS